MKRTGREIDREVGNCFLTFHVFTVDENREKMFVGVIMNSKSHMLIER